ncbi:MAG: saccharopine dehydrogenase, partial [Pseudomonadota bacterium]
MTVAAAPPKRVLVVGATGVFGGRLARHLARHGPAMDLLVSSRDGPRADALAAEIGATGLALHTGHGLAERLRTLRCFAVIDCSGPFQRLSHGTARAAVASGAHAIDLADARDYLLGYSAALDDAARAQGVAALAGASSTPALSGAVARALTAGWSRVDMLDIAITPGGRSEIGRAALEAVISCVGRDVPVWRDGRVADTTGWGDATVVDMPGLGRRRVAAVETVDAEHLGPKLGVRTRVTFRAGLESAAEQHGLELLARLRRWGWLGDPAPLLPLLLAGRRITRLPTGDHGGMRVGARGID